MSLRPLPAWPRRSLSVFWILLLWLLLLLLLLLLRRGSVYILLRPRGIVLILWPVCVLCGTLLLHGVPVLSVA